MGCGLGGVCCILGQPFVQVGAWRWVEMEVSWGVVAGEAEDCVWASTRRLRGRSAVDRACCARESARHSPQITSLHACQAPEAMRPLNFDVCSVFARRLGRR